MEKCLECQLSTSYLSVQLQWQKVNCTTVYDAYEDRGQRVGHKGPIRHPLVYGRDPLVVGVHRVVDKLHGALHRLLISDLTKQFESSSSIQLLLSLCTCSRNSSNDLLADKPLLTPICFYACLFYRTGQG